MCNSVEFPSHIADGKEVNSQQIQKVIEELQPLNYLRSIYVENKSLYFEIIDELNLRGIHIDTNCEKTNKDLFPNSKSTFSNWLISPQEGNKYKMINFDLLGLNNFVSRFKVDNDNFFHLIPLEGFIYLNKSLEPSTIINVFNVAGFEFKNKLILEYNTGGSLITNDNITGAENYKYPVSKTEIVKSAKQSFQSPLLIEDIYTGSEFSVFNSFCAERNVKYITDIDDEVVTEIKRYRERNKFKGLKGAKINQVSSIYQKALKLIEINNYLTQSIEEDKKRTLELDITLLPIYPVIREMSIREVITSLNINEIESENEDYSRPISNINVLEDEEVILIKRRLLPISTLDSLAERLKEVVTERDFTAIKYRSNSEETLESIGEKLGVTRERIRQIIRKSEDKMLRELQKVGYPASLYLMKSNSFGLSVEKIKKYLEKENYFLLNLFKRLDQGLIYREELNYFLTNKENDLIGQMISKVGNMPETMLFEDFNLEISNIIQDRFEYINIDDIQDFLLLTFNFKKYGNYISRGRLTVRDRLEIIFGKYVSEPLKLDDEGVNYLNSISKDVFGSPFNNSTRSIDGRIRDVENIILVDPQTYQWIDKSILENSIWNKIKLYIDKSLSTKEHINVEEIYELFKAEVNSMDVKSKHHLYSIIKYLYEDEYEVGKGNTLNIYKQGVNKRTIEEVLEELLKNSEKELDRGFLAKTLNWKLNKLDLLISSSPKFIQWDNNIVKHISSIQINKELREVMYKFIISHMPLGYLTTPKLFEEMQFDNNMSKILRNNNIHTHYVLGNVVKTLFPDIKGHIVFLYKEGSEIKTGEDAVLHRYPEKTSRREILDFITDLGYSEAMASQILSGLLQQRVYVEIDTEELIKNDSLKLGEEVTDAVKKFIEDSFGNKEYVVISQLQGYRRELPSISYRWTHHLIHTIGVMVGYRHVQTQNDYRYDQLVLVRKDSSIHTFDQLVYSILKANREVSLYKTEVAKYLFGIGLLRNDQRLPFELSSSDLFTINELGWMTLKEGV